MPRWLPSRSTPRAPSPSVQDQDVPSHMHTASTTTDSVPHQDPLTTLNLNPDIWPSFSPSSSSGSAAATPWTLGLGLSPDLTGGLSPPPRARRASARSLGLRTTATHPLRRVQSLESSASGGAGAGSSSAGSSGAGAGGREQFAWRSKERVEEDTASDQISSPGTFGGERDGRRGESSVSTSSISAPSSTSASVMPRSLLSSEREPSREWSEWGSSPRTTGGGMSLGPPPRSRERMRERREVSGETTGARTFDEKSWEFKVAEALFLSSPARSPSSSSVSPSSNASPAGSSTARFPLPQRQRSVPLFATLGGGTPSPPQQSNTHLSPPPTSNRLRAYKSSPEVLRRRSPPPLPIPPPASNAVESSNRSESSSDEEDEIWHDAASFRSSSPSPSPLPISRPQPRPHPRPRTVTLPIRPSSQAALEWSAYPLPSQPLSSGRNSFRAISNSYLIPSPPLSPRDTLLNFSSSLPSPPLPPQSRLTNENPFGDDHFVATRVETEEETFEEGEEDIRLPFPIQSILSSTLSPEERSSLVHPSRNFLSSPLHPQSLEPSSQQQESIFEGRRNKSKIKWRGRRMEFRAIPLGGWLFLLGFIFPFCWWFGAFHPYYSPTSSNRHISNSSSNSRRIRRTSEEKGRRGLKGIKPSISLSDLPSHRRTYRLSWRGKLPLLGDSLVGEVEVEPSLWVWRRRNRVMSVGSFVVIAVCLGVGIWSGVQQRSQTLDQ